MVGIQGVPVNQIAKDVSSKSNVQNTSSDFSFSDSLKEAARDHTGKIESLKGYSIEEFNFWKNKMRVEDKEPVLKEDVHDLVASFKQKIKKILKDSK